MKTFASFALALAFCSIAQAKPETFGENTNVTTEGRGLVVFDQSRYGSFFSQIAVDQKVHEKISSFGFYSEITSIERIDSHQEDRWMGIVRFRIHLSVATGPESRVQKSFDVETYAVSKRSLKLEVKILN